MNFTDYSGDSNKIAAYEQLALERKSFPVAYRKELNIETVLASEEYFTAEVLKGKDHFDVDIWEVACTATIRSAVKDFSVLFCGGCKVRFNRLKRSAPNASEIVKSVTFDVPEWR